VKQAFRRYLNSAQIGGHGSPLELRSHLPRSSFPSDYRHFPLYRFIPRESPALPCRRESPSHPPGAKDHVSGILDPFAKRSSGEVVAENWNSVPHGRWSLLDRRACEMSAQRLVSVVCYSQQVSRVNAAIEGPRRKFEGKKEDQIADRKIFRIVRFVLCRRVHNSLSQLQPGLYPDSH
jgi:hypothetical protein